MTETPAPLSRRQSIWLVVSIMMATVMQVLDTTIVNVALPHIQGDLAATPSQIGWVLTSYIVPAAIFMTLTGYFSERLGQRRYLVISMAGFTVTSVLCGLADSLSMLVTFRILQGIFGASLVPMSQAIMVQNFPPEARGRMMGLWSVGVMVGPILGPTLGGWLTDALSWRWTFFINLPLGVVSTLIAWKVVPQGKRIRRPMDWWGFVLLVMALGGLQMLLDRGAGEDWYESNEIRLLTLFSVVGFIGYFWHSAQPAGKVLVNLEIFKDRNFSTSCLLMVACGIGMYGTMVLLPLLMQNLLGYTASQAGLMMAPRGIASMISMVTVGRLMDYIEPRRLVVAGAVLFCLGTLPMTNYSLQIDSFWLVVPGFIQGLGLGMLLVPLSTLAYSSVPPALVADATGVFSLMRTLGQALGISIVTMLLSQRSQIYWHELGAQLRLDSSSVQAWLLPLGIAGDSKEAGMLMAMELGKQSHLLAFLDSFVFVLVAFIAVMPALLLIRKIGTRQQQQAASTQK
ncbi:DHA2 family efflux MFS transporter permease subunit [Spongiibacter sp. KMU-158]|uniref:DHA2 family efflux MFS transporter permease subunit n=1 Tax=Spongiibacter pelagi TaxID=2760804 RepID=A0A927GW66_9GAMM|nr:DHA2 family efflux MFS transporter permease subunit [Spongiibacter pelagi]MBD2858632.1 DHA2 family efflux MFS transporter permease subunit [Spongiibacter pelagi]